MADDGVTLYEEAPWFRARDLKGFDYRTGQPARLIKHLELAGVLGCWTTLADLDGDGLPEIVTVQCAYGYDHPCNGSWGYDLAWARVWCLTAVDREGNVLWQHGTPWTNREAFPSHGGPGVIVRDLDRDGEPEIVTAHRGDLFVFAADGRIKRSRRFADQVISDMRLLPPSGDPVTLMIRLVPADNYEPSADFVLDPETLEDKPAAAEFSCDWGASISWPLGDGNDGLLMNAWLYDAHARVVRRLPEEVFPDQPGVHADHIARGDLDGDGRDEIVYCIEYHGHCELVALDPDFNVLFRRVIGHAQQACIVPPAGEEPGVVIVNDRSGCKTIGLDARGKTLWEQDLLAYPGPLVRRDADTFVCMLPHRMKQVVPAVIDRWGTVRERFQEMLDYRRPVIRSRYQKLARYRSHDLGRSCAAQLCDWNGDGIAEIAMSDRHGAWVYAPPAGAP